MTPRSHYTQPSLAVDTMGSTLTCQQSVQLAKEGGTGVTTDSDPTQWQRFK